MRCLVPACSVLRPLMQDFLKLLLQSLCNSHLPWQPITKEGVGLLRGRNLASGAASILPFSMHWRTPCREHRNQILVEAWLKTWRRRSGGEGWGGAGSGSASDPITLDALAQLNAFEQKKLEMQHHYRAVVNKRKRRIQELEVKLKYTPDDEKTLEELCELTDQPEQPVPDVSVSWQQAAPTGRSSLGSSHAEAPRQI